jgi:hypothetical protein
MAEVQEAMKTPETPEEAMVVETPEDREWREAREAEAEVHLDTIADAAIPCVLAGLGAMVRFVILDDMCDGDYSHWQAVEDRILEHFPAGVPWPDHPFMIRCVRFKPFARDVCRSLCTKTDDRRARDPGFRREGDGGSPPWRSTSAYDWWCYAVEEVYQHNATRAIGWHVAALTALAADPQTDTWDKLSARYVARLRPQDP